MKINRFFQKRFQPILLALSFLRASPYFSFLMATGWHAVPSEPKGQGRGTNAPFHILVNRSTTCNRITTCPKPLMFPDFSKALHYNLPLPPWYFYAFLRPWHVLLSLPSSLYLVCCTMIGVICIPLVFKVAPELSWCFCLYIYLLQLSLKVKSLELKMPQS